jgi:hypothetical protein
VNIRTKPKRFPSVLNQTFEALEDLLEGCNYTVFLWHYHDAAASSNEELAAILSRTLPKPEILVGGSQPSSVEELISDIAAGIGHVGGSGYGPIPERIRSEQFQRLLRGAIDECKLLCGDSSIELFWLKQGHPAYPVFWDFAFAIRRKQGCDILIGSSSD